MMKYIRKGGKKDMRKYRMEKKRTLEIMHAMKKYIRKEGQKKEGKKEIRIGKGNMCRNNEMNKYIRKEEQKEHN